MESEVGRKQEIGKKDGVMSRGDNGGDESQQRRRVEENTDGNECGSECMEIESEHASRQPGEQETHQTTR